MRLFFVTDLHGSTLCFRKFINSTRTAKNPDVLLIGGDITGKHFVPIIEGRNSVWSADFEGVKVVLRSSAELRAYCNRLEDTGAYTIVVSREEWDEIAGNEESFAGLVRELQICRLESWLEYAQECLGGQRLIINAGNDDPFAIDQVVEKSPIAELAEGRILQLGKFDLVSTGYSNITPWSCPRDVSEHELMSRIEAMTSKLTSFDRCIFNFHCPPVDSGLDRAKRLGPDLRPEMSGLGTVEEGVGSSAVRNAIEKYQPLVSLHGHIHEQHGYVQIGRTLCFNPGSEYQEGRVRGVFLEFSAGDLIHYGLTREQTSRLEGSSSDSCAEGGGVLTGIRRWGSRCLAWFREVGRGRKTQRSVALAGSSPK